MLSSKTLAKVMLIMASAGVVATGLQLVAPPVTPEATTVNVTPVVSLPSPTLTTDSPEDAKSVDAVDRQDADDKVGAQSEPLPPEEVSPAADLLALPAAGFAAPLSETSTVNGVVTPPDFAHAFRVTDVGSQVYVTHSCRYEECLGNALFNMRSGEVFAKAGQTLWVAGKRYEVTEVRTVAKDALPFDGVWRTNGVAVITCFQNKDSTPSTQNLVVIAQPADIS